MTPETKAAIERLRADAEDFPGHPVYIAVGKALAEIERLKAVVHRMVRESNGCAAPCAGTRCGCWLEAEQEMES